MGTSRGSNPDVSCGETLICILHSGVNKVPVERNYMNAVSTESGSLAEPG